MRVFLENFDVTTEVVCMVMCVAMLLIIWMTKPARTRLLHINISGFVVALLTMSIHIGMLNETIKMSVTHDMSVFRIKYLLYCIGYITVLNLIYSYLYFIPYRKKKARYWFVLYIVVASAAYLFILMQPVFRLVGAMKRGEEIVMGNGLENYIYCSLLCVFFCGTVVATSKKLLAKVVFWGTVIFLPVIAVAVFMQSFFDNAFFICATYTLPFILYYILFHSASYDVIMGCQDKKAEANILDKYIAAGKKFIRISVHFTKLENRDYTDIKEEVAYAGNIICRKVERLSAGARIYRKSDYDFSVVAPVSGDDGYNSFVIRFLDVLSEMNNYSNKNAALKAKVLIFRDMEELESAADYYAVEKRVVGRFDVLDVDEVIAVTKEDALKYKKSLIVEKAIRDITIEDNIDDERVLLYIQPIYKITEGKFKTGEALMRMNIDGKIYYPDSFIPVAESTGTIHALTRIILHKAALKTLELSKYPEFDAISVNVSTAEMGDPNLADEFEKIILDVGANPKNIRLEITESTTIVNYDVIVDNMNKLRKKGIYFYLDDFGTGFSNLDRVIGMPFRTIKFDKSLLYKALSDDKSRALLEMLLVFCKSNNISTVVEGVENETQREYVAGNGFDYIQGYFYSKPVPESECDSFYNK